MSSSSEPKSCWPPCVLLKPFHTFWTADRPAKKRSVESGSFSSITPVTWNITKMIYTPILRFLIKTWKRFLNLHFRSECRNELHRLLGGLGWLMQCFIYTRFPTINHAICFPSSFSTHRIRSQCFENYDFALQLRNTTTKISTGLQLKIKNEN